MILFAAWLAFGLESLAAIFFGAIFWRLWSRSAMSRKVALSAIMAYGFCCALSLMLTFFVPL